VRAYLRRGGFVFVEGFTHGHPRAHPRAHAEPPYPAHPEPGSMRITKDTVSTATLGMGQVGGWMALLATRRAGGRRANPLRCASRSFPWPRHGRAARRRFGGGREGEPTQPPLCQAAAAPRSPRWISQKIFL